MSQTVVLTGMVLNAMPIGDYDKRITILTRERGKITAFARGARRPNSQLLAPTNPFSFGEFELFEGRSSYTLTKANISNYFRDLADDYEKAYMGFYFMEFADYFFQENNDEKEMLKLLYMSLRALESTAFDKKLVRVIFELKSISINGQGPDVFRCNVCRKQNNLLLFSVEKAGVFCQECSSKINGMKVNSDTIYTMQYIISSEITKLYNFAVSKDVLSELIMIMKKYLHHYIHHTFNSEAFL